jgi:Raf kinase inhibitor-like YbhB/YbcL family protein
MLRHILSEIIFNFTLVLLLILLSANHDFSQTKTHHKKMEIKLYSTAFKNGDFIPSKYSCEGSNVSPQIHWNEELKDVKSFAIIVDDPDAPSGDFVHLVIYNIPANVREIHEDVTPSRNISDQILLGTNSFGHIGYSGPCPPSGKPHRYFFRIYALDTLLHHLESGATKAQLEKAMQGHIIGEGEFMGKYQRSR